MTIIQFAQFWLASFSVDPATWAVFARQLESIGLLITGNEPRDEVTPTFLVTYAFFAALLALLAGTPSAAPEVSVAGARRGYAP
jgi:hypothetical protein